MLSKNCLKIMF